MDGPAESLTAAAERFDRQFAEARAAGAALGQRRIEAEIEASLGTVAVDAWGGLLEVRLNRAGLRVTDPRTVGPRVLRAIHCAEARAAGAIQEYLDRWGERRPRAAAGEEEHAG